MTIYQQAEATARKLGFNSYADYLGSDHWIQLRMTRLKGETCCVCSSRTNLIAHHKRYKQLLDVTVDDLVPMCFRCHDLFHIACRQLGIPYLDLEAARIAQITLDFKASPKFIKREAKRVRRVENQLTHISKGMRKRIQRQFKNVIRGQVTRDAVRELSAWLLKELGGVEQPEPDKKPKLPRGYTVPHTDEDLQMPEGELVVLTKELVARCRANGSFTNATLRAFGLHKPLVSGWAKRLEGQVLTRDQYLTALKGRFIYKSGPLPPSPDLVIDKSTTI